MIRVAFFSGDITRSGGTERVGVMIANEIDKMEGFQVSFVSLTHQSEKPAYPVSKNIICESLSKKWINPGPGYLPVIFKLNQYVKKHQIDILVDIDGVLDILSIPVKWMRKIKLISWEHFNFYKDLGTKYRKIIRKMAARYADVIVTLTEQDKGFYLNNLKIRHKILSIHNPIEEEKCHILPPERDFDKKIILSVGRLVDVKGFDQIPVYAYALKKRNPELKFVWWIAGEGEEREKIERKIKQYGVEEQVRLLGQVKEVATLYRQALLYVMMSKYEGLPMVLLEAKEHSLPCISYDILTGPSEIIQDGINGFLVPEPEDRTKVSKPMLKRIEYLLKNKDAYEKCVSHAKDNIGEFQMGTIIEKWKRIFLDLESSHPDQPL